MTPRFVALGILCIWSVGPLSFSPCLCFVWSSSSGPTSSCEIVWTNVLGVSKYVWFCVNFSLFFLLSPSCQPRDKDLANRTHAHSHTRMWTPGGLCWVSTVCRCCFCLVLFFFFAPFCDCASFVAISAFLVILGDPFWVTPFLAIRSGLTILLRLSRFFSEKSFVAEAVFCFPSPSSLCSGFVLCGGCTAHF